MSPARYLPLAVFAAAFGAEEAIIVLYLRSFGQVDVHLRGAAAATLLPSHVYDLEIAREICTLLVLGTVAALSSSTTEHRVRAFLFAFGSWDMTYYVTLWALAGSPGVTSDDVLFLIPIPWVAPVWAVFSVACVLVCAGVFGVARGRVPLFLAGLFFALASFVYQPAAAMIRGGTAVDWKAVEAAHYPLALFAAAIVCLVLSLRVGAGPRQRRP